MKSDGPLSVQRALSRRPFALKRFRDDDGQLAAASCAWLAGVKDLVGDRGTQGVNDRPEPAPVATCSFVPTPDRLPLTGAISSAGETADQRFALLVLERPRRLLASKRALPETVAMVDVSGDPASFDGLVVRLSRQAVQFNSLQRARRVAAGAIDSWAVVVIDGVPGQSSELRVGLARVAVPETWWPATALSLPPCTEARGLDAAIAHQRRLSANAAAVKGGGSRWLVVVRECGAEHLPLESAA